MDSVNFSIIETDWYGLNELELYWRDINAEKLRSVVKNVQLFAFFLSLRFFNPLFASKPQTIAEMFIGLYWKQPRWHWRQLLLGPAFAKRRHRSMNSPF